MTVVWDSSVRPTGSILVKREFTCRKLFFVIRDLMVLRDPRRFELLTDIRDLLGDSNLHKSSE